MKRLFSSDEAFTTVLEGTDPGRISSYLLSCFHLGISVHHRSGKITAGIACSLNFRQPCGSSIHQLDTALHIPWNAIPGRSVAKLRNGAAADPAARRFHSQIFAVTFPTMASAAKFRRRFATRSATQMIAPEISSQKMAR